MKNLPADAQQRCREFADRHPVAGTHASPEIVQALCRGFSHRGYWIEATRDGQTVGSLPLVFMQTMLFGRLLVSLPYLNWGGALADDADAEVGLVDRAAELADELNVRFLELRHENAVEHPKLTILRNEKCQMRMPISTEEAAWKTCRSTVRTQVRKGDKQDFEIAFGHSELLEGFYEVFARNMRDLGTPVYSKRLFAEFLSQLGQQAELCVVRKEGTPIAGALLFHHSGANGITEVPSASALREYRPTAVNTWMYWQLIKRAVEHESKIFDFGRSTPSGPTFDFKRKWGATPSPTAWQFYARQGEANQARPDNDKYNRAIETWKRLPIWLTKVIGPKIVRGIP